MNSEPLAMTSSSSDTSRPATPSRRSDISVRAAQVVVLSLSFTAGAGCTRAPNDGTSGGGGSGGGSGSSGDLGDAIEEQNRLECECYLENEYYSYYYDSVEECVEARSSYGIPDALECIETELDEVDGGREYLDCITDVIEDFNICAKKRGCNDEYYDGGVARRCRLEAELGYYDCIEAAGGYEQAYEFQYAIYECIDDGWYSEPGYGGGSSGGGYGGGYGGEPFLCTDGQTIPMDWKCDLEEDCSDGSDEADCMYVMCGDGTQLPEAWRCDGEEDCNDGADEATCASSPRRHPLLEQITNTPRAGRRSVETSP